MTHWIFVCGKQDLHELSKLSLPQGAPRGLQVGVKGDPHLSGRRITFVAILSEGLHADGVEGFGDPRVYLFGGRRRLQAALKDLHGVSARKRGAAGQEQIQGSADGEHVGAGVDGLAQNGFGRDITKLAFDLARLRLDEVVRGFGDAEVDDLHLPFESDQDVFGGHVAVNEVQAFSAFALEAVGVIKPCTGIGDDAGGDVERDRFVVRSTGASDLQHIAAVEVLHRQKPILAPPLGRRPGLVSEVEDLHHVGVVDHLGETGLVDEHADEVAVVGEVGPHAFDDDEFLSSDGSDLTREIDFSHSALGELARNGIAAQHLRTRRQLTIC